MPMVCLSTCLPPALQAVLRSEMSSYKLAAVLPCSELAQQRPQNGCPEREWLPEECIGSLREKSKKVFDHCELFFSETGYTQDLLKQCGIIASTSP